MERQAYRRDRQRAVHQNGRHSRREVYVWQKTADSLVGGASADSTEANDSTESLYTVQRYLCRTLPHSPEFSVLPPFYVALFAAFI
jgi:hypothetical protein